MTISDPNAELRQGDWLQGVEHIPIATSADEADLTEATPHGVAVLTQCCDLAQNQSGVVHVSPIVKLSDTALADAKAGRTSRYASIYDDIFADLAIVATMSRDTAGTAANVVHRMNAQQRSLFADEIARRFSRFAYPDEVVTVLRPLTEQVRKKARKGGAVGQVLQRVAKLRLECEPSWDATEALTITLLVIVEPQFLPAIPDDYDVEIPAMPPPEIAMDLTRAAEQILVVCPAINWL